MMEILLSVIVIVIGGIASQLIYYKFKREERAPIQSVDLSPILSQLEEHKSKLSKLSLVVGLKDLKSEKK